MTRNSLRKIAVWVFACAFCVVLVVVLISLVFPGDVKLLGQPGKSGFKFAAITEGTNHVIFLGNPVVARLRWWGFSEPRFRRLAKQLPKNIRADWIHTDTAGKKRVLWVGLDLEEPEPSILHCSITNSIGHHVELRHVRSFESSSNLRAMGMNMQAFELPRSLGKRKEYNLRIYGVGLFEQENELATLQVR